VRRTSNDFGKVPGEFDAILAWNQILPELHRESGSEFVDSTLPLDQVVDEVLRIATT
jgi:hypothetical protein